MSTLGATPELVEQEKAKLRSHIDRVWTSENAGPHEMIGLDLPRWLWHELLHPHRPGKGAERLDPQALRHPPRLGRLERASKEAVERLETIYRLAMKGPYTEGMMLLIASEAVNALETLRAAA